MVHQIEQQLGSIDILVNNAGMAAVRSLDDITEEDFDRAIAVNLKSVFLCPQAVLQGMRNRRWIGEHRLWRLQGRSRRFDARLRTAARGGGCDGQIGRAHV